MRQRTKIIAVALRIGLLFLSIAVTIVVCESVLRGASVIAGAKITSRIHTDTADFVILTLGESTTQDTTGHTWPLLLEKRLSQAYPNRSIRVINKAIPGTNTSVLVGNLPAQITEYQPDVIVSMMGINDQYEATFPASVYIPDKDTTPWLTVKFFRMTVRYLSLLIAEARDFYHSPDPYVLSQKADMYRINGEYERAERYLRRSITLEPDNPEHLMLLAILYRDMSRNREAEYTLLTAKLIAPTADGVYVELGNFYRDNGNHMLAEEMYKTALLLNPQNGLAYDAYGMLASWYQGDMAKARELYEQGIRYYPTMISPYFELADIYIAENNIGKAKALYEKVLSVEPNSTLAKRGLARVEGEVMGDSSTNEQSPGSLFSPMTVKNYGKLLAIASARRIPVIAVQYPLQSAEELRSVITGLADSFSEVTVVGNEENFRDFLQRGSYDDLFSDHFGGNFGHTTERGSELIAAGVARTIETILKR
ncbi:MAG: tetratricopeptide repeat protein [Patescibacteria group bacterium]